MVSRSTSGEVSLQSLAADQAARLGQTGTSVSPLRPGGKAQFGDAILDVIAQGELVEKGKTVRIIGFSGTEAVVEVVG